MLPSNLQQPYRYISNRAPSLTGTASHECKHYSQTLSEVPAAGPKHCRHAIVMTNGRLGPRRRHRTPAQLHLLCAHHIPLAASRLEQLCHTYAYVSAAQTACRVPPARQVPLSVKLHEAVQPSIDDLCPYSRDPHPQGYDPQPRLPPNFSYILIRRTGTVRHAYLDI